jgi:nuclear-control-of-ATPase protein 2
VEWRSVVLHKALACLHQDLLDLAASLPLVLRPFRPPGRRERLWMRYGVGAVAATAAGVWLVRHSRLAGSGDLDRWTGQLADSVATFYKEHVRDPVSG